MKIPKLSHDLDTERPIFGVVSAKIFSGFDDGHIHVEVSTDDTSFDGNARSLEDAHAYLRLVYPSVPVEHLNPYGIPHHKAAPPGCPLEALVEAGLQAAEISYVTEKQNPKHMDFYLPDYKVHIEVKAAHSDMATEQLKRAPNVILVQGDEAARFFAGLLAR